MKVIHDITFNTVVHEHVKSGKEDSAHTPNIHTVPSVVTTKPPPTKERNYPDIKEEEIVLQYIKRCGGSSTHSAAVVLGRIFKTHGETLVSSLKKRNEKKRYDKGIIYILEFIIFSTTLLHRCENIFTEMMTNNVGTGYQDCVVDGHLPCWGKQGRKRYWTSGEKKVVPQVTRAEILAFKFQRHYNFQGEQHVKFRISIDVYG